MKKLSALKLTFLLTLIVVIGVVGVLIAPHLSDLNNIEDVEKLVESFKGFGFFSVFIFLALQVLQIVIFVVPGEVMELAAGMFFGSFFGTIICLIGIALGSGAIFVIAKWLGFDSVHALLAKDSSKIMAYLEQKDRLYVLLFLLFFIPGVPRDALTYFVPFTSVSLKRFLAITMVARLPSIISSTYLGASIFDGNIILAIIIYAVVGGVAIVGYFIHRKMQKVRT